MQMFSISVTKLKTFNALTRLYKIGNWQLVTTLPVGLLILERGGGLKDLVNAIILSPLIKKTDNLFPVEKRCTIQNLLSVTYQASWLFPFFRLLWEFFVKISNFPPPHPPQKSQTKWIIYLNCGQWLKVVSYGIFFYNLLQRSGIFFN